MAKAKTVKTGYDRIVTEDPKEGFLWQVGPWHFAFMAMPGINLSVKIGEEYRPCNHCKDLKEAGLFAEGFHSGAHCQAAIIRQAKAETDALVKDQPDDPQKQS